MFDQCPEAMKEAETNNIGSENVVLTDICTMQNFPWEDNPKYSAIYMRWCSEYLTKDELIEFLKQAKARLSNKPGRYTRKKGPDSYIIVLDNIDKSYLREKPLEYRGRIIQTEWYYDQIFETAKLVEQNSIKVNLNEEYMDVKIWALY